MCNCKTCDGTGRLTERDPETGSWSIQCDDCQGTGIGENPILWHWEEIADELMTDHYECASCGTTKHCDQMILASDHYKCDDLVCDEQCAEDWHNKHADL